MINRYNTIKIACNLNHFDSLRLWFMIDGSHKVREPLFLLNKYGALYWFTMKLRLRHDFEQRINVRKIIAIAYLEKMQAGRIIELDVF